MHDNSSEFAKAKKQYNRKIQMFSCLSGVTLAAACVSLGASASHLVAATQAKPDQSVTMLNEESSCVPVNGYRTLMQSRVDHRQLLEQQLADFNKTRTTLKSETDELELSYYTSGIASDRVAEARYRKAMTAAKRQSSAAYPKLDCNKFS